MSATTFASSRSDSRGGGLSLASTTVTLADVTFQSCVSTDGGAMYIGAGVGMGGERIVFSSCTARGSGGGFFAAGGAMVTLFELTFTSCGARNNGGALSSQASLILRDSVVQGGSATRGAALYIESSSTQVFDSVVESNAASAFGGVAYVKGELALVECRANDNSADEGGGALALDTASIGDLELSTFSNNRAPAGSFVILLPESTMYTLVVDVEYECGERDDSTTVH